jgi:hypothetical protein
LRRIPDFSLLQVDFDTPPKPGFINVKYEAEKIQLPISELQRYFSIDFKTQLRNRLQKEETEIRNYLESLGFLPSTCPDFQHFMLRVKPTRIFAFCEKCYGQEQPKICLCLREYWDYILTNGPIEWNDFGPCGYCCGRLCYEKTCECMHDRIVSPSTELKRLRKQGIQDPCELCFRPVADCRCHFYEGPSHFENYTHAGELYGDTTVKSGYSTPGNLTVIANPDFSRLISPPRVTTDEEGQDDEDSASTSTSAPSKTKHDKTSLDETFIPGNHFVSPDRSSRRDEER